MRSGPRSELTLYPLFVRLLDAPVLVVGGGTLSTRRVKNLLLVNARVTVVSPVATADIQALAASEQLKWHSRKFQRGDVVGMKIVFATTDSAELNHEVTCIARQAGCWTNDGSQGAAGDIVLPAVARLDAIDIAISTRGVSPTLAKRLRILLEADVEKGSSTFIEELRRIQSVHESDAASSRIPNDLVDL